MEEVDTPSPSRTPPSTSPVDERRRALPFTADMSTEIVNLVSDPTTTTSSGTNLLFGASFTPGKPTSESPINFRSAITLVHVH